MSYSSIDEAVAAVEHELRLYEANHLKDGETPIIGFNIAYVPGQDVLHVMLRAARAHD